MHANTSSGPRNALARETSPYLRQHADNPVQWYPWGTEALELARTLDRPILLSIGYSACHWCHVMAHESFADPVTAEFMNERFVNVKVDREERPDLDRIYQTAHQVMNQAGGGWPLTVFLAPDTHRPFFSGTYFPPEQRYGMPAFRTVLEKVAGFYASRKDDLREFGDKLVAVLGQLQPPPGDGHAALTREPLGAARATLQREFDGQFGGFGDAPKFPHPANLELLLRAWRASAPADDPDLQALYMSTLTLTRMAEGGLYDQLGGGFSRYSVDPYWMIPHFEKMLYDNGQLLGVYAQAAVAAGEPLFRRVAAETAEWMLRDLGAPEGAFYSTLDADSEGHEGRFYVWTPDQVRGLLAADENEVFARRFGLDREPNFEGKWHHLHVYKGVADIATELAQDEAATERMLDEARRRLLDVRNARVWPARDEKILASWNGLAIGGLARASRALGRDDLADAALRAARFLRAQCWRDGRLLAVHTAGQSRFPAYLDDYAALAWGLLELLEARWDPDALAWTIELVEVLLARFADTAGGFFFTADDAESLIVRPKTWSDDATPAGNGLAARALVRLGFLLAEPRYLAAAEATLRAARAAMERYPHGHGSLLMALDEFTEPPAIVVLRGAEDDLAYWTGEIDKLFDPKRMVVAIPRSARDLPSGLADKSSPTSGTVAYICRGMTCSAPVRSLRELLGALRPRP